MQNRGSGERVFICVRFKPKEKDPEKSRQEFEKNLSDEKTIARFAALRGFHPIATTIYYTAFLNDFSTEERLLGQKLGRDHMHFCDWIWIFPRDDSPAISMGMREDIDYAEKIGIKKYFWRAGAIEEIKSWVHYYDLIIRLCEEKRA